MLAAEAEPDKLRFPLFASPKLDGIRCAVVGGKALTRTLKEVPNRTVFNNLSQAQLTGLDGELIVGDPTADDVYRNTVSGVMSRDGNPEFTYYVFDLHDGDGHWHQRFQTLYEGFADRTAIQVLPHAFIRDHDELLEYEQKHIELGYEGVILRDPKAPYKHGRSTVREGYLLKLKRFQDSEAEILDVIEEMHNGNEAQTNELGRTKRSSHKENKTGKQRMGALLVRDIKTGVEFQIGTGFNDTDKAQFWLNDRRGQLVKYKFFPVGVKDKPRHPVYLGLRSKDDL